MLGTDIDLLRNVSKCYLIVLFQTGGKKFLCGIGEEGLLQSNW